MATQGSTNVTTSLSAMAPAPIAFGGESDLILEVFRCQGGAAADTIVLTPSPRMSAIYTVICTQGATTNASTSGTTNVTLTLTVSSTTSVVFDAWVVGRRPA